jgi:hypothetical protein
MLTFLSSDFYKEADVTQKVEKIKRLFVQNYKYVYLLLQKY